MAGVLQPYTKSKDVYLCPAAINTHYAWLGDDPTNNHYNSRGWLSIGYNSSISIWYWTAPPQDLVRWQWGKIRTPAKTVLFADTLSGNIVQGYHGYCAENTSVNYVGGCSLSDRHGGGGTSGQAAGQIVVGLADAHAKSYSWSALKADANLLPKGCDPTYDIDDANAAGLKWMIWGTCIQPD